MRGQAGVFQIVQVVVDVIRGDGFDLVNLVISQPGGEAGEGAAVVVEGVGGFVALIGSPVAPGEFFEVHVIILRVVWIHALIIDGPN